MKEILRDRMGRKIGEIEDVGRLKVIRDRMGRKLGDFDGRYTRDRMGRKIGEGNLLTTLLQETL